MLRFYHAAHALRKDSAACRTQGSNKAQKVNGQQIASQAAQLVSNDKSAAADDSAAEAPSEAEMKQFEVEETTAKKAASKIQEELAALTARHDMKLARTAGNNAVRWPQLQLCASLCRTFKVLRYTHDQVEN